VPPSSRVEILVQGPAAGIYLLRSLVVGLGPDGDTYPEFLLATLDCTSGIVDAINLNNLTFPTVEDLRGVKISQKRTIIFSESPDGLTFYINGNEFNMSRIDVTTTLGSVEEWTILNNASENHLFHIHQVGFQVVEVNGVSFPFQGRQDTVQLPYQENNNPGEVKIIIPFTEPEIIGKFVFHCHIMEHEDNGMMAIIQVLPTELSCVVGTENCFCGPNNQCFSGLSCISNVCVQNSPVKGSPLVSIYVIISIIVGVVGLILITVSVVFFIKIKKLSTGYQRIPS